MIFGVNKTFYVVVILRFLDGFITLGLAFFKTLQICSIKDFVEILTKYKIELENDFCPYVALLLNYKIN
jgi:hypothetical protein